MILKDACHHIQQLSKVQIFENRIAFVKHYGQELLEELLGFNFNLIMFIDYFFYSLIFNVFLWGINFLFHSFRLRMGMI